MTESKLFNTDQMEPDDDDDEDFGISRSWIRSKWMWAVIGLAVAPFLILGWFWFQSYQELNSKLKELKSGGWPTTATEVNAFYRVPEGVADRTQEWMAALQAVEAAKLMVVGKDLPILGNKSDPIPPPREPWDDLEACRQFIDRHQSEIALIRKAASVPGQVRFPVDFSAGIATLLPQTQNSRIAAKLLQLDAHVSTHDGNFRRAHQDIMDILALSNALCGEPCMISQLVRSSIFTVGEATAEEIMPSCDWSDAELLSLQKVVLAAHFEIEMQNAIVGDTAITLTALDTLPTGTLLLANKTGLLELMGNSRAALSRPWPEPLALMEAESARMQLLSQQRGGRFKHMSFLLLAPATDQTVKITCRVVARQRCFILGLAAYRHRLKHGHLPASLAELDPSLVPGDARLKDLSLDPFDGQPLRVRSDEEGLLIYSVYQNLTDDGGDVAPPSSPDVPGDLGFLVAPTEPHSN